MHSFMAPHDMCTMLNLSNQRAHIRGAGDTYKSEWLSFGNWCLLRAGEYYRSIFGMMGFQVGVTSIASDVIAIHSSWHVMIYG
jgi:hypothetical protein